MNKKDLTQDIAIIKLADMNDTEKADAIRVFIDSFYDLYKSISKDKKVLNELFLSSFDFNLSYGAVADNKVIGFLGISNSRERSLKFRKAKCTGLLGPVMGNITYHEMNFLLGRPNLEKEQDIGIDYLATDALHRGRGVAGRMIEYTCTNICSHECFIDVAANNSAAKSLYEHSGFQEYDRNRSLTKRLLGFGHIIRMKKTIK